MLKGPDVDPWYLFGWCKLRTTYLQSLGRGATFGEISKRIVESIEIPLPGMQTQRRFREALESLISIDQERSRSTQRVADLLDVLFSKAFSGALTTTRRKGHTETLVRELERSGRAHADAAVP